MTLAGSVGSVAVGGLFLIFKENIRKLLLPGLVSYAAGTFLGAAFLGMIPKALHDLEPTRVFQALLLGILVIFCSRKHHDLTALSCG
jgi:zinc and cadmium transporter